MTRPALELKRPGLFVTATDTEIGKTTLACAIAACLKSQGLRVGVCKPIATGCRSEREGLVSDDAEALAHFADCRAPLERINPVRYANPLAPAVAAELEKRPVGWEAMARSLQELDANHDVMIVEGIGGWAVPLDADHTVEDLARWIGYPVLVVCGANLGTLNHTALTCDAIRRAGCRLGGIAINRFNPDSLDTAEQTNPAWLARQNRTSILATLPRVADVAPQKARLPEELLEATSSTPWRQILQKAVPLR